MLTKQIKSNCSTQKCVYSTVKSAVDVGIIGYQLYFITALLATKVGCFSVHDNLLCGNGKWLATISCLKPVSLVFMRRTNMSSLPQPDLLEGINVMGDVKLVHLPQDVQSCTMCSSNGLCLHVGAMHF